MIKTMKLLPFSFLRMLLPRPLGVDGDASGGGSPAAALLAAPDKIFSQAELDSAVAAKAPSY